MKDRGLRALKVGGKNDEGRCGNKISGFISSFRGYQS
jgi:hypothetical protein